MLGDQGLAETRLEVLETRTGLLEATVASKQMRSLLFGC